MWETCRICSGKVKRSFRDPEQTKRRLRRGTQRVIIPCPSKAMWFPWTAQPRSHIITDRNTGQGRARSSSRKLELGCLQGSSPTKLECGSHGKGWLWLSHRIITAKSSHCLGKLGNCLVLLSSSNVINQREIGTGMPGPSLIEKKKIIKKLNKNITKKILSQPSTEF